MQRECVGGGGNIQYVICSDNSKTYTCYIWSVFCFKENNLLIITSEENGKNTYNQLKACTSTIALQESGSSYPHGLGRTRRRDKRLIRPQFDKNMIRIRMRGGRRGEEGEEKDKR